MNDCTLILISFNLAWSYEKTLDSEKCEKQLKDTQNTIPRLTSLSFWSWKYYVIYYIIRYTAANSSIAECKTA